MDLQDQIQGINNRVLYIKINIYSTFFFFLFIFNLLNNLFLIKKYDGGEKDMKYKKIIIFASILILFLSINSLNATDNITDTTIQPDIPLNEHDITSIQKNQKESSTYDVYVDSNSVNEEEDGSIDAPYKTLNNQTLDKITDNSTIHIFNGTYNLEQLTINKNISIIGEDRDNVIIVPQDSNLFTINDDTTVTFTDLSIKNFHSSTTAAIINNGNLTITNLNFKDNNGTTTTTKGGCILNNGYLSVNDSSFENNTASFGAAIYNTKQLVVNNTKFKKNNISNVGGAIYSLRANAYIYNCNFINNAATSGAAIYNAAGYLYVEDTEFYRNDAERFFGGAIYSTGVSVANNSQFLTNHAKIDGGAITNTNNFTFINCVFEQNNAQQNGGAIENVAWATTENGNLTIINSTFTENSAGINGGAIINYNKDDYLGNSSTITARGCIFDSNSASKSGGAVYNQQYIDLEYNVFISNDADSNRTISSDDELIKSIEYNWWATNNPTKSQLGVMPEYWIVMNFTNTTLLVRNLTSDIAVTLDTLNNGEKIEQSIPSRYLRFTAENTTFTNDLLKIQGSINDTVTVYDNVLYAQIDKQQLMLDVAQLNVTQSLVSNNQTLEVNISLPGNLDAKTSVKINSLTIFNKQKLENGRITLDYDIPVEWTKSEYNMTVIVVTGDGQVLREDDIEITIPKRYVNLTLEVLNQTPVMVGSTVQLVASLDVNNKTVNSGRVSFKINGLTIESNVQVVDGMAVINYTIPSGLSRDAYNFTVVYSGDANKQSTNTTKEVQFTKHDVYSNMTDTLTLKADTDNQISLRLYDEEEREVNVGRVCYKINYITQQTNITLNDGTVTFNYKTPELKNNSYKMMTLTIKYSGTANYKQYTKDVNLTII